MNGKTGNALDLTAFGAAGAVWVDWLPPIVAILSIIWLTIRICDWIYARFKPKEK